MLGCQEVHICIDTYQEIGWSRAIGRGMEGPGVFLQENTDYNFSFEFHMTLVLTDLLQKPVMRLGHLGLIEFDRTSVNVKDFHFFFYIYPLVSVRLNTLYYDTLNTDGFMNTRLLLYPVVNEFVNSLSYPD